MSQRALAVSQAMSHVVPCVVSSPLGYNTKFISQHYSRSSALQAVSRALPSVLKPSCAVSQSARRRIAAPGALCHDTRPPSRHNTNDCITTHPSGQAVRAHAAARPARRLAVSQGLLAVSQGLVAALFFTPARLPGRVEPGYARPSHALCHNTTCCMVTQP